MLLQRVAVARAAGDWRAARGEWEACITRARERVENVVDGYVVKGWIPRDESEDVVQDTLIRAGRRLVETLDRLDENAFFASMVRAADFQCRDEGRKQMRRQMKEKPLDQPSSRGDDGDATGRFAADEARQAEEQWLRDAEVRQAGKDVDDLIPRLRDPRAQKILTLQRLGHKDPAIAEELGLSMVNLYKIRSRALMELRGLIDP